MEHRNSSTGEPVQLPRFGHLRQAPPVDVLAQLDGAAPDTDWTTTRMGGDGGYPNGGIWRLEADRKRAGGRASVVVKRTGAALSVAEDGRVELATAWQVLEDAYCEGLVGAGWSGDLSEVRRSARISNQLRMGWWVDHLLDQTPQMSDAALTAASRTLTFLSQVT